MKRTLSILLLIFSITCFSQTYHYESLLNSDLTWNSYNEIHPRGGNVTWGNSVSVDVMKKIFLEYEFNIVNRTYNGTGSNETTFYIREDSTKRVSLFKNNTEYLLYDFNAEKGDTLFQDTSHLIYFYITNVDSININNSLRKRFFVHSNYVAMNNNTEWIWIEGVGNVEYGLLSFFTPDIGLGYTFCSLQDQNEMVYPLDVTNCISKHNKKVRIIVYPTIVINEINIKTGLVSHCNIYDLLGKLILKNVKTNTKIDLSFLPRGVYFVKIEKSKDNISVIKVIKK